jgi:hypothetical protein
MGVGGALRRVRRTMVIRGRRMRRSLLKKKKKS